MKKIIFFLFLFLMVLALHARAIHDDYREADEKARTSYAFGMAIGSNFDLSSMGIELDYTAFAEGFRAMNENEETQFSEQEAMEIIEIALQAAMEKKSVQNRQAEEEFLNTNSQRPEVRVTQSGLQYVIIKNADGEKPKADSVVRVHYTGTFTDGSPFDNSVEEEGAFIPLEFVFSGWTEGLMLMSVGSQYRLYIPSYLAYGIDGIQGIIPPYSTLIFTVELLEIVSEDYE